MCRHGKDDSLQKQSYPVAYFKKIKEYCDKNGIELICVTSPITPSSVKRLGLDVVNEKFESSLVSLE